MRGIRARRFRQLQRHELSAVYRAFAAFCLDNKVTRALLKAGDNDPNGHYRLRDALATMAQGTPIAPEFKLALIPSTRAIEAIYREAAAPPARRRVQCLGVRYRERSGGLARGPGVGRAGGVLAPSSKLGRDAGLCGRPTRPSIPGRAAPRRPAARSPHRRPKSVFALSSGMRPSMGSPYTSSASAVPRSQAFGSAPGAPGPPACPTRAASPSRSAPTAGSCIRRLRCGCRPSRSTSPPCRPSARMPPQLDSDCSVTPRRLERGAAADQPHAARFQAAGHAVARILRRVEQHLVAERDDLRVAQAGGVARSCVTSPRPSLVMRSIVQRSLWGRSRVFMALLVIRRLAAGRCVYSLKIT